MWRFPHLLDNDPGAQMNTFILYLAGTALLEAWFKGPRRKILDGFTVDTFLDKPYREPATFFPRLFNTVLSRYLVRLTFIL